MSKNILKELRNAVAGLEGDATDIVNRPYAGHAFENELMEIDEVTSTFDLELGCEGYAILDSAVILTAATEEDGSLNIAGITDFGTEAVLEKAKQIGYKGKAMGKKIVNAIIAFVKRMINVVFNKNVALKKFGKLIKKYKEKLIKKSFSTSEKNEDKEITIREFGKLQALVSKTKELSKSDIKSEITTIKGANSWDSFFSALNDTLCTVSMLPAGSFDTIEKVNNVISDKTVETKFEDVIEGFEIETKQVSLMEAKSDLVKVANQIEGILNTDIKIQEQLRKFVEEVSKKRDKLYKDNSETDNMAKQNLIVNKAAVVITKSQSGYTKLFKHTSNALNAFLTDMHKVISA